MTLPKKQIKQELDAIKKDVLNLPNLSPEKQVQEIVRISLTLQEINRQLPLGTVVELGTDGIEMVACAVKPDLIACASAFFAVIDLIKYASDHNPPKL